MKPEERIIVALDVDSVEKAVELVEQLKDHVGVFKVGLELINVAGIQIFEILRRAGASKFFYDVKLHDIPNTVSGAMAGISCLNAWCVTVHASGGSAMLKAAVETARKHSTPNNPRPRILAVTVLTSINETVLQDELYVKSSVAEYVTHLALMAHEAGCDGVIASPNEIETIRAAIPDPEFLIVTPGVRPAGSAIGDQARVMTPGEAVQRGASLLVVGRPIVAASDPVKAAQSIAAEIASVL